MNRGFLSLMGLLIVAGVIMYVVIVTAKSALQSRAPGEGSPQELIDRAEHARDLIENRY